MKILVTQRIFEHDAYKETRECLDIRWIEFFNKLDFTPIIVSSFMSEEMLNKLDFDGLLLTGGNDLSILNANDLSFKRDNFETTLLENCLKKKLPVFGICRGLQLICHFFGSELAPVKNHVATRHALEMANSTSRFFSPELISREVNSYHNHGIKSLGNELVEVARSKQDGVLEAIEHKEQKVAGIMWHPEREEEFSQEDKELIKSFFEEKR